MTDSYYGARLSVEECEELAFFKIRPELRAAENSLYTSRWFDYRHLHPVQATYLFADHYKRAVQRWYAHTKDIETAHTVTPFKHEDVFQTTELTSIWLARQAFDRIGCRYDLGLDFALKRAGDRGWGYFPRPNQLYGSELLLDLADHWNWMCGEIFQEPKGAQGEHVTEMHQWLIEQCKRRVNPERLLGTILSRGLLPEHAAREAFEAGVVEKALKLSASFGVSQG